MVCHIDRNLWVAGISYIYSYTVAISIRGEPVGNSFTKCNDFPQGERFLCLVTTNVLITNETWWRHWRKGQPGTGLIGPSKLISTPWSKVKSPCGL